MSSSQELPKPPEPLPQPTRLIVALAALCSTLHPSSPSTPSSQKAFSTSSTKWLQAVCKLIEFDPARLPSQIDQEQVKRSAAGQREDWTEHEIARIAGVLVEASLAADAAEKKDALHYTPLARSLSHQTLQLLNLPAGELLPQAEKNLSVTLFHALKAAQEQDKNDKVEATRAAHSEGWGGFLGRNLATGAGVIAGGVLIGVTGGLAAPALAAVLAPLGIGGLFSAAAAPMVFGTLFGVGGGGLAGRRVRERWAGVAEFGFIEVGNGTKATKEEIADLMEAREKMKVRKAKEKNEAKDGAKQDEKSSEAGGNDGEKTLVDTSDPAFASPTDPVVRTDTPASAEGETSDEQAAANVEAGRADLEEQLLHLSLEAGHRRSISMESGGRSSLEDRRPSLDSPRPSLDQAKEEKGIEDVKKPPSLTVRLCLHLTPPIYVS